MNLKFMNLVLEKCTFPEEACIFFRELADRLISDGYEGEFDSIVDEYITSKCHTDMIEEKLKEFVGHTPVQVLAGVLIGGANAVVAWLLLK